MAELVGRTYPGLVPSHDGAVGMLIIGLSRREWRVLDAFEDRVYEMRRLALTDDRHGWAYVCPEESQVSQGNWDAERFAAEHLDAYVEACTAWRQRYDDLTTHGTVPE